MHSLEYLNQRLEQRKTAGSLRSLKQTFGLTDFSSNDYLGLARSTALQEAIHTAVQQQQTYFNGATGSRLLSGNSALAEELETELAHFHQSPAALLFNSGYDANLGLFSCLASRHDTYLYDALVHASILDGIRLSAAKAHKFAHNDLDDLERKLQQAQGERFIVVESVYSMDGDLAPLVALANLANRYSAHLIVDEAHATGVFGPEGAGLVQESGLQEQVLARVHTFGKALGVHGAVVLGSTQLRDYLINFSRPFIYTTALPPHALLAIRMAYDYMRKATTERRQLLELIEHFRNRAETLSVLPSTTPIQGLLVPGNAAAKNLSRYLQEAGLDVRPILSPTVAEGKERLRICLHSFNTIHELDRLFHCLTTF